MAEGSAHLCRCTIATMAILFIISLGLFIAAWNINTINSIFGLQESGGNAPAPPASHNFTYMNVDVGGGVEISVRLGNWNPPNSSMVVNSTSITYVVLLHGVPEAGELCFRDIIGTMPTTWIYIIPDLRGAGNSSKPPLPEAYAITTMISDLWIVLNQTVKANTSVNLVGVDFGGVLSFAYAHTYPSQVRTLTTVEAAHPYVIQSLLQQYSVQRANFSEILKYMLPEADSAYSSGFASFPILESGMSWWTSRMSEYKTLWSLEGGLEWTSVLNYWRTNLILSPAWNANGAEFNSNTTFNWNFNATGQQITATIKMIYGFPSKSYYMLPSAASSSAAYIKKYAPPVYIANGTHWIHHGLTANSTADQIKQNILNA